MIKNKLYKMNVLNNHKTFKNENIGYVSEFCCPDLFKITNSKTVSKQIKIIEKVAKNLAKEKSNIILFTGNITSNYFLYKFFVTSLSKYTKIYSPNKKYIFVLGSYEIMPFKNLGVHKIVEKYKNFLNENGMFLLYNSIFYELPNRKCKTMEFSQLQYNRNSNITSKLKFSDFVIFGSTGFAGYNGKKNFKCT